jgi:UDP-N-acetylglucosamine 2-epimerase
VAIRECSYLGVPAINIGSRQANRERGPNVVDVDYQRSQIVHAISKHFNGQVERTSLYGNGDAGTKIADILANVPLTFVKSINYI